MSLASKFPDFFFLCCRVFGYVGNRCATFPLQLHGVNVSALNSVQFSHHAGYGDFPGSVLDGDSLDTIVGGLRRNGSLAWYQFVITGYVGSESFLKRILHVVEQIRAVRPGMVYVCDPVMGDNGSLYVPKALVDVYRTNVVPLATVMTPN